MNRSIFVALTAVLAGTLLCGCEEEHTVYSDAEYVMFADQEATYPVEQDVEYFEVPVASTVACDYDRTFGVEVIDRGSNAVEGLHYRLRSNTITIKAGERSTSVGVHGIYDNIEPTDSLGFILKLVMPEQLEMPLYGSQTNVVMMKSCPFDIDAFTGYCMVTSLFLYEFSSLSYQRLIYTEKHPTLENTIICRNFLYDGYDITMTFEPDDPLSPTVGMDADQVLSDEASVFGTIYGDNKILVAESSYADSYFYSCRNYVALWFMAYAENLGTSVGTVGHFYNILEWVSDEEADRLRREDGI